MKAILLVRGSTERQEVDTQKNDLVKLAINDGYEKEDLIIIGSSGASARKRDEAYLRDSAKVYSTIKNDPEINAVYAWEISRIGRHESNLFEFKNFLLDRKIQLVIYQPSLRLLNEDGSVNNGVEMCFSLFATWSKQEMDLKMERFARGKARNRAEGKYCGGRIKLGYKLDETKHFIINPERAELVRTIFTKYANGESSVSALHRELVQLGIYHSTPYVTKGNKQMNAILKDPAYIGKNGYPRIISDELFEKAQAKLATHPHRHRAKNIYFCVSLLKDSETGYAFATDSQTFIYTLNQVRPRMQISVNYLDFACWFVAMNIKNLNLGNEIRENREKYEKQINENNIKVNNIISQKEELTKQIDRAISMNIEQPIHFSTEKMNAVIDRCEKQIMDLDIELANLRTDISRVDNLLKDVDKLATIDLTDELSDKMKREIIESVIDKILVTRIEQRHYKIQFVNKVGYIDNSYWIYDSRGCGARGAKLVMVDANGAKLDVSSFVRKHKRFIRTKK